MRSRLLLVPFLWLCLQAQALAAPPPLEAYARLPAVNFVQMSPSGGKIAYVVNDKDRRTLFVRSIKGETLLSSALGAVKLRGVEWGGDDYLIVFVTATAGKGKNLLELGKTLVLDVNTGKGYRVFERSAKVWEMTAGTYGTRVMDGRRFGFFAGVSPSGDFNLYRVDLETGLFSVAGKAGMRNVRWVLDVSGRIVARVDYDLSTKEFVLLKGDAGTDVAWRKISPLDEIDSLGLGRSAGTVLIRDETGDEQVLLEVDVASGRTTPLFEGRRIDRLFRHPETDLLLGGEIEGSNEAVFLDAKLGARHKALVKAFPRNEVSLTSHDGALDRFIAFTDGGDDSGTFWTADMASREVRALAQTYPEITPDRVGPTRMIRYKAADGLDIDAVLTLPPGRDARGLPLILMPHGGPLRAHDEVGFNWMAQAFASRGYAVLQPNFRGSGGRGVGFIKAGFGQWGRKMQTDLSDGVAHLVEQGIVDPARVCIAGGSAGGYAALAGVTLQQGVYRCAVSYAGVSDIGAILFRSGDANGSRSPHVRYMREAFGAKWAGDPQLRELAPVRFADRARAPVLLIHGKDDTVVPIAHSEAMFRALGSAAPHEFVKLDGEDHWLSREETRIEFLRAAIAFIEKHNPPQAAPSAAGSP